MSRREGEKERRGEREIERERAREKIRRKEIKMIANRIELDLRRPNHIKKAK